MRLACQEPGEERDQDQAGLDRRQQRGGPGDDLPENDSAIPTGIAIARTASDTPPQASAAPSQRSSRSWGGCRVGGRGRRAAPLAQPVLEQERRHRERESMPAAKTTTQPFTRSAVR